MIDINVFLKILLAISLFPLILCYLVLSFKCLKSRRPLSPEEFKNLKEKFKNLKNGGKND